MEGQFGEDCELEAPTYTNEEPGPGSEEAKNDGQGKVVLEERRSSSFSSADIPTADEIVSGLFGAQEVEAREMKSTEGRRQPSGPPLLPPLGSELLPPIHAPSAWMARTERALHDPSDEVGRPLESSASAEDLTGSRTSLNVLRIDDLPDLPQGGDNLGASGGDVTGPSVRESNEKLGTDRPSEREGFIHPQPLATSLRNPSASRKRVVRRPDEVEGAEHVLHVDAGKAAAGSARAFADPVGATAKSSVDGVSDALAEKRQDGDGALSVAAKSQLSARYRSELASSAIGHTVSDLGETVAGLDKGDLDWFADGVKKVGSGKIAEGSRDLLDGARKSRAEVGVTASGLVEGLSSDLEVGGDIGSLESAGGSANQMSRSELSLGELSAPLELGEEGSNFGHPRSRGNSSTGKWAAIITLGLSLMLVISVAGGAAVLGSVSASNNNAVNANNEAAAARRSGCAPVLLPGAGQVVGVDGEGNASTGSLERETEERRAYMYANLLGLGLNDIQAAGVLGNMQVETASTFSPQIYNPNDVGMESFGIVQWRAGRRVAVEGFLRQNGVDPTTSGFKQGIGGSFRPLSDPQIKLALAAQLAYFMVESVGAESAAWQRTIQHTTAADVASAFDRYWERSSGEAVGSRMLNANSIFSAYAGKVTPIGDAKAIFDRAGVTPPAQGGSLAEPGGWTPTIGDHCAQFGVGSTFTASNGVPAQCPPVMAAGPEATSLPSSEQSASTASPPPTPLPTVRAEAGRIGGSGDSGRDDPRRRNTRRGGGRGSGGASSGGSFGQLSPALKPPSAQCGSYATQSAGALTPVQLNGILNVAMAQVGKPYVWGAEGPGSFDCSGLVVYAFQQNGLPVPGGRTASNQGHGTKTVAIGPLTQSVQAMLPGDLLFWDYEADGTWDHVGFYIGGGKMVHAPQPGDVVKVVPVYDSGALMKVGRV